MLGPGSPLNRGNIAHTLRSVVWMDRKALSARAAATSLAFAGIASGCGSAGPTDANRVPDLPPGTPVAMEAAQGAFQVGFAGRPVDVPPAVRVTDPFGSPVEGVVVTFTPDPGSGTVSQGEVMTGADGVAGVGSWTLGPDPTPMRLRARVEELRLPNVTFLATATVPPAVFDIEIRWNQPGGTPAQREAFRIAESRWQALIVTEAPDVPVNRGTGFCGSVNPIDETVDDLLILADIVEIDGPGGTLGSAGPCLIREGSLHPIVGRMRFDKTDLDALEANGLLEAVILHEMGHVLGIGGLWDLFGLVADSASADTTVASDPHFIGGRAQAAFELVGGSSYEGDRVPVEDQGGAGTRLVHWREAVLENELMTGFVNGGSNPLSVVTIESLADMGYEVDATAAEAYSLSLSVAGRDGGEKLSLGDDLLRGPIYAADPSGRIRLLTVR